MNNVTAINNKAPRLTEEEVHEVANQLESNGNKVSTIEIYKVLGRGSMTTINKFLDTWKKVKNINDPMPENKVPDDLKHLVEDMAIKIWQKANELSQKELSIEKEAMKQAIYEAEAKKNEAEEFSDIQNNTIEEQKAEIEALKIQIEKNKETEIELEKTKLRLENSEKELEKEKHFHALDIKSKAVIQKQLEETKEQVIKLEKKIKTEELRSHKVQTNLDICSKELEKANEEKKALNEKMMNYKEEADIMKGEIKAIKELKTVKTTTRRNTTKKES